MKEEEIWQSMLMLLSFYRFLCSNISSISDMTMALILHNLVKQHLNSFRIQILVVGEGGHLDIVVTGLM